MRTRRDPPILDNSVMDIMDYRFLQCYWEWVFDHVMWCKAVKKLCGEYEDKLIDRAAYANLLMYEMEN